MNDSCNSSSTSEAAPSNNSLAASKLVAFYTWFGFTLTVCLVASVILLLLLASSLHQNSLHTGSRLLLMHLMFIQLVICALFNTAQAALSYEAVIKKTQPIDCRLFTLFYLSVYYAENWSSALMALNRFVAIELPHHYKKWLTKYALAASMVLPWVIGFSTTLPIYLGVGADFTWNPRNGVCFAKASKGAYMTAWLALGIYLPMALIGVTYIALFLRLLMKRYMVSARGGVIYPALLMMPVNGHRNRVNAAVRRRHIRIAKMLMMAFVWYCLCFLPGPVITINFPALYVRDEILQLWLGRTFSLCGYAASPVSVSGPSNGYQLRHSFWPEFLGRIMALAVTLGLFVLFV